MQDNKKELNKRISLLYHANKKDLISISFKFQFNDKNSLGRAFLFDVTFLEENFPSHIIVSSAPRKLPFRINKLERRAYQQLHRPQTFFFLLLPVITDCHRTTAINQFRVQQLVDEEERCSFRPPNDILMRSPQSRWERADKSIKK